MSITKTDESKTLSVYDPTRGAFYEAREAEVRLQMKALGLSEAEVEAKIKKLKGEK